MNPIQSLQCRAYLCYELVVFLLADELSAVYVDWLVHVLREVERLHGLRPSPVSGDYVEDLTVVVEQRW